MTWFRAWLHAHPAPGRNTSWLKKFLLRLEYRKESRCS